MKVTTDTKYIWGFFIAGIAVGIEIGAIITFFILQ